MTELIPTVRQLVLTLARQAHPDLRVLTWTVTTGDTPTFEVHTKRGAVPGDTLAQAGAIRPLLLTLVALGDPDRMIA